MFDFQLRGWTVINDLPGRFASIIEAFCIDLTLVFQRNYNINMRICSNPNSRNWNVSLCKWTIPTVSSYVRLQVQLSDDQLKLSWSP